MSDFWAVMTAPLVTCFILVGMHAYLGLHVVRRGIIFVDLALSQVAALGATTGFLLGYGLHTTQSYFVSLVFTLVAAGIFSLFRFEKLGVPQEAFIGIVYAISAAASIVVLSLAPQGGEELKALLVGHLLFVGWEEIQYIALLYSLIGIIHWVFRRSFYFISEEYHQVSSLQGKHTLLDFIFYATFGVVVTSSVELAGVLLVFCFLVVPALCGVMLAKTGRGRLGVGWISGFVTSAIGVFVSYYFDLPTGATVACLFGVTFGACATWRMIFI